MSENTDTHRRGSIELIQLQVDRADPPCEEAFDRARAYETDQYPVREDSGSTTILAEHFQPLIAERDALRARVAALEEALREVITVHKHQDHDCDCPQDFCESEHADPDNCAACDPCNCCKSVDDIARAALSSAPVAKPSALEPVSEAYTLALAAWRGAERGRSRRDDRGSGQFGAERVPRRRSRPRPAPRRGGEAVNKIHLTMGGEVRCKMWSLFGVLSRTTDRSKVTCGLCLRAMKRDDLLEDALKELTP